MQDFTDINAEELLNWLDQLETILLTLNDITITCGILKAWTIGFTIWATHYNTTNLILDEWENALSFTKYLNSDIFDLVYNALIALSVLYNELQIYEQYDDITEKTRKNILNVKIHWEGCNSLELKKRSLTALEIINGKNQDFECLSPWNNKIYNVSWCQYIRFEYIKSILKQNYAIALNDKDKHKRFFQTSESIYKHDAKYRKNYKYNLNRRNYTSEFDNNHFHVIRNRIAKQNKRHVARQSIKREVLRYNYT